MQCYCIYMYIYATPLMACHLRALSSQIMLSATLIKCWPSSLMFSWLPLVASVRGCMGTSAARDNSCMRDTMSVGCSPSCWVSSRARTETSNRADAWARLLSSEGCCPNTAWGWRKWVQKSYSYFFHFVITCFYIYYSKITG